MVPHPIANVFTTSQEEADRGALSVRPDGVLAADISGIRSETVAALMHSAQESDYDPGDVDQRILGGHKIVHEYTKTHGGWLFRFSDDDVRLLATIANWRIGEIARRWSLIFEFDAPPLPEAGEVESMLRQVVTIAQNAASRQLPMYWLQEGC